MILNNSYATYILDLLSHLDNISMRKMFGGYGIYQHGIIFGIIINDIVYFKVDESNQKLYTAYNSEPFSYEGKNKKRITLSYWQVPSEILENRLELENWVDLSVSISQRVKRV
jgi:DNA transformation protein and related proteins